MCFLGFGVQIYTLILFYEQIQSTYCILLAKKGYLCGCYDTETTL